MILITGATGFIGQSIIRRLPGEVVGVARTANDDGSMVACDLVDAGSVRNLIETFRGKHIEALVHAAGVTPWSPTANWADDSEMASQVIRIAQSLNIPKIVYLSGWVVYDGVLNQAPFFEGDESKALPVSDYGRSKLTIEQQLAKGYDSGTVISLRLASIYGPGQVSAGLIPNLVQEAMTSGTMSLQAKQTKRDYLYIKDAVEAIVQAVTLPGLTSQSINIGSGTSMSMDDVAKSVQRVFAVEYKKEVSINYAEFLRESLCTDNVMSIERATTVGLLNEKGTDFDTGVSKYIHWKMNA